MVIAVDWDDTLVDSNGDWLPGALDALRGLRRNHRLIIWSARARTDWGKDQIRSKLGPMFADVKVEAKPSADIYIDDRAVTFAGWPETLREVRRVHNHHR